MLIRVAETIEDRAQQSLRRVDVGAHVVAEPRHALIDQRLHGVEPSGHVLRGGGREDRVGHLQAVADLAAEEVVDGRIECLAGQVVERHIHARGDLGGELERRIGVGVAQIGGHLGEQVHVEQCLPHRVAAQDDMLESDLEPFKVRQVHPIAVEVRDLAQAGKAVVGLELDDHMHGDRAGAPSCTHRRQHHSRDLHRSTSCSV